MMAQSKTEFRKKTVTHMPVHQMQHGLAVVKPERQTLTAVDKTNAYRVNQSRGHRRSYLIHVTDECQVLVIPALFVGLKVDGIERTALPLPPWELMSDEF